jgi:cytochrome P450 family 144
VTTASATLSVATPWDDVGVADEPDAFYRALRDEAPVWNVPGTSVHFVSSWDLVTEAVARAEDFSSELTAVIIADNHGCPIEFDMRPLGDAIRILAGADGERHAVHRKLVVPHLTAARLEPLAPEVDTLAARLWEEAAEAGRVEWMAAVGDRLPMTLVTRVIGLPADDVPELLDWAYQGTDLLAGLRSLDQMVTLQAAADAHVRYLTEKYHAARAAPRDDLLGDLARAEADGRLQEHEVIGALVILVGAGGESTAGLIGNAARVLAERPDLQTELRADPALVPRYIEEILRYESPFRGHYRHVRNPSVLGGVTLAADSHLYLMWSAANRDPRAFDDPDEIRLDRKVSGHHLAFGRGIHFCVGAPLARMEAVAAIGMLLARTTSFALDADVPPTWEPSIFVRRHRQLGLVYEPASN